MKLKAFFQRWWSQQSEEMKVKVKELVDSGQLEFMYVSLPFMSFQPNLNSAILSMNFRL